MARIARPFIPWIGSKEKLIPYIWQVFPPNPKLYLEPFGGGGALLLGIQPKVSRMDIYNDFNCDLVNLFLCARECTVQLVRELKFIPFHSRAEFDLLKEFMMHKDLLQQRIADERNAVMECFSGEEREELLEMCIRDSDCPALLRMTNTMANVDELDWLGKQLESFDRYELLQFNAAVERFGLSAADELIDLSFCARERCV